MQDMTKNAAKHPAGNSRSQAVSADLIAVVIAVTEGKPRVLTVGQAGALPSGPFELGHRSLQSGLRAWVERQTGHPLGYIEQLYTFADQDRIGEEHVQRVISISYLALTREEQADGPTMHGWQSWYDYFPWEDHRAGVPAILPDILMPRLRAWADEASDLDMRHDRWQRAAIAFGLDGRIWNEELALQRYELLYEAALVAEAERSGNTGSAPSIAGRAMIADHRRILATGIGRLRTKIKYRPVVFELMPPTFTLLQLQRTVEALAGRLVHKPNFRRLIEEQDLIEETGETMSNTGGRPAKRFRFRQTVLAERTVAGTKLPLSRV
jgi:hypothetical protein